MNQKTRDLILGPGRPNRLGGDAKYDAARTTDDNRAHWRYADGASSNASNTPEVRRILRNRARYEDDNNSYVNGLTGDRANETIGTGPRLQLALPETYADPDFAGAMQSVPPEAARTIERRWLEWCNSIGLHDKLIVMDRSETREGESFALKFLNPKLPATAPQLDIRVYEADQVETPDLNDPNGISGIEFDQWGNPTSYHILKTHPGDMAGWNGRTAEYDKIPARSVIHWFEARRASQARGVPAFTSSLPLYSILRRWTLAGLLTAEAQSRINAVITQENAMPEAGAMDGTDPAGDQIKFAGTHMLTLSAGQDAKTLPASAPAANYREVKTEILTECGRSINSPRNVSSGSSHEYNYSSGRLDMQQWQRAIRIRRSRIERIILNVLFAEWLALAAFIPNYLPEGLPPTEMWSWEWQWPGFVSIDPVKDANASTERMANGTSNLKNECGERGEDWEEVQDQRLREELREKRRREMLGLPPKVVEGTAPALIPAGQQADGEDDPNG